MFVFLLRGRWEMEMEVRGTGKKHDVLYAQTRRWTRNDRSTMER